MQTFEWKAASAYVIGRSHEKEQTLCQDRTYTLQENGIQVIALADGAGSAKLSHLGAEAVVRTVSHHVLKQFSSYKEMDSTAAAEQLLDVIMQELQQLAEQLDCEKQELASTLLFVASDGKSYVSGHLGDGLIAELNEGLSIHSHPDNGEYANSTYFTTSKDALVRLRIRSGECEQVGAYFLMSDGTSSSMYRKADDYLSPALATVASWLEEHDEETVNDALLQNLNKSIRMKTFDDCSLAVMTKVVCSNQSDD